MTPPELGSRYRAIRPLGRGGQGSVWLAEDVNGREVAVKLLSVQRSSEEGELLRREYAHLARLRHPGLAEVEELFHTPSGGVAMVSEVIDGPSLRDWWEGAPLDTVVHLVAQLVGILDFLHQRGLVHRDVKPDNVLVTDDGVTLVDLGLARLERQTEGELAGTVGYIAPEVLAGEPASPRSDLYSVGVLLFEAIWHRLPFHGEPGQVVSRQLAGDAAVPDQGGSPGLRALVRQLLARQAVRRPPSAAETLGLLEELEPETVTSAAGALVARGLPDPVLVCRAAPLRQMKHALDRLHQGHPTDLLIVGRPGTGRTRMCEELAGLAGLQNVQVQRGLRVQQLPPAVGAVEPAAEGAQAVQRLVDTIREQSALGPLLLLLDDLRLGFESGVLLAIQRLRDDESLPLMICATVEDAPDALAAELEVLELSLLDEPGVAELVGSMLPARWDSAGLAARVHQLSGGIALLAVDLTRVAVARRQKQDRPGSDLRGALDDLSDAVEQQAAHLTRLRLELLDGAGAALAGRVALMESGLPLATLESGEQALVPVLVRAGVAQERAGRLELIAGSVGQLLLQQLDRDVRRRLCQQARVDEPTARAELLVRAGLTEDDAKLVLEGARRARERLDLSRAVRLFEAALRSPGGLMDHEVVEAVRDLASLRQATGDMDGAVALLEHWKTRHPGLAYALADAQLRAGDVGAGLETIEGSAATHATARVLRAKLLLFAGRHQEALEACLAADLEGDQGRARAEVLHTAGLACYYLGDLPRAREEIEQAIQLAASVGDRLLEAKLENSLALIHQRSGAHDRARSCYTRCVGLARELGHLPFEATFSNNLGSVAQQQGDYTSALASYTRSLEVARSFGGAREVAQVAHNLGRLLGLLGQPERARGYVERSLRLSRSQAWRSMEAHNLIVRGELSSPSAEQTVRDLEEARAVFNELGDVAGAAEARLALARVLLETDLERAGELAREVTEQTQGMTAQQIQAFLIQGQASLRGGRALDQARLYLRNALRLAEDTGELESLVEIHLALSRAAGTDAVTASTHTEAARQLVGRQLQQIPEELREGFLSVHPELVVDEDPPPPPSGDEPSLDADLLAALLEINKELAAETDLRRLLERIIDHAVDLTGAERGFLLIVAQGEDSPLTIEVARNIDQETIRRRSFKISRSVAEEVLQMGKAVMTVNAMDDSRFADFLSVHNLRLRSILSVPMTIRRQVRGAIYVDNRFQVKAFTEAHGQLLGALADQAALAVGNRELMEQLTRKQRELERSRGELEHVNRQLQEALESQRLELVELSRLAQTQRGELEGRYQFDNLIGQSGVMRELFRLMDRVKDSDAPVNIHGESGTGKELVAKALHYNSPRQKGPFVSVNCGALPPSLLESELFGYEKGAFTGAQRRHRGLFERSHGGSLFLDEVGDMPPELQVKLLRVLQEKTFQPVGGEEEQNADFRLLAASNKDLSHLVREGSFREDLFYRINVIQLRLPPLRERREDIPLLVEHLLTRHGGQDRQLSRATLGALMDHDWPGNVRELENELLRALALGGPAIGVEDLSPRFTERSPGDLSIEPTITLKQAVAEVERTLAITKLTECGGNVTRAAAELGITRVGLHKLMTRHGIRRDDVS